MPFDRENQFKPGKLWNLSDLLKFAASPYLLSVVHFVGATSIIRFSTHLDLGVDSSMRGNLGESLLGMIKELEGAAAGIGLILQAKKLHSVSGNLEPRELVGHCDALINQISIALSATYFLSIENDKRRWFEAPTSQFAPRIIESFPDSVEDISGACRCFALGEATACVFHLMRVLELGLKNLAERNGIENIEHANWQNIIDQIEKKIRERNKLPKSDKKVNELKKLSEAAVQFRYFKDAWRNHVSHAHVHYDIYQATSILIHVRAFMEAISE